MIVEIVNEVVSKAQSVKFWSQVQETKSGCWEWTGYVKPNGYGEVKYNRQRMYAHRLAFTMTVGAINDLQVLHSCDNRSCVNPKHLFLGSQLDNMRDKVAKNRQRKGEGVHFAKVTEADVRRIKERYKNGETQSKIGAAYGLTQSAISFIVNGKNWKHI